MAAEEITILTKIKSIIKKDGQTVEFKPRKVLESIQKASQSVGLNDQVKAFALAQEAIRKIEIEFPEKTPTTEEVSTVLEKTLMEKGESQIAKAYILYRHKKTEDKHRQALILGKENA